MRYFHFKYRQTSLLLIPIVSAFQNPAGSTRIALPTEKTHVLTPFENSFSNAENIMRSKRNSALNLYQDFGNDDIDEFNDGDTFRFSKDDLTRIQQQYERKITLPIIICSTAILPGQSMEIRSSDPKLQMLVDYILNSDGDLTCNEIGIMGLNPHDRSSPLTVGVTASVTKSNVKKIPSILSGVHSSDTVVQITGKRSFEIEEEPFLHESDSFYMAHVEIIDDREEIMSQEQVQNAEQLSKKLPSLIKKWKDLVNSQSQSVRKQVQNVMKSIGPLPSEVENDSIRRRALWVGSLVNPSSTFGQGKQLCPEIRPALLACKNNYQRIYLAVLSLQSSIDHLSQGEAFL